MKRFNLKRKKKQFFQTEAEQTRAEAMKQEEVATKLKNENQLIRDEAETDLSTRFLM